MPSSQHCQSFLKIPRLHQFSVKDARSISFRYASAPVSQRSITLRVAPSDTPLCYSALTIHKTAV